MSDQEITHALRTPCPIDSVMTWCGKPMDRLSDGKHFVVGIQDHAKVDCEACRKVIADTLEQLRGFGEDLGEEQWLAEAARECRCCSQCWQVPCGGCAAGGVCDALECTCERGQEADEEDDG